MVWGDNVFQVKSWSIQGNTLHQYRYANDHIKISFLNVGASIHSLYTRDTEGKFENIVLTYNDILDYHGNVKLLGSSVGPYAGRLSPANIPLRQSIFELQPNFLEDINLHSGSANLAHVFWDVEEHGDHSISFVYTLKNSPYYPGELTFKTHYEIIDNTLVIEYHTVSHEDNYASLTNHSYFNLSGDLKRSIENHELYLPSHQMGQLNEQFISQSLVKVHETLFDFNHLSSLDSKLKALKHTPQRGLDHPFILTEPTIVLQDPDSRRRLTLHTNQEAVVVYSNNFIEDVAFYPNIRDKAFLGICLETQSFPNDIHFKPNPHSFLKAHKPKVQRTKYTFDLIPN